MQHPARIDALYSSIPYACCFSGFHNVLPINRNSDDRADVCGTAVDARIYG